MPKPNSVTAYTLPVLVHTPLALDGHNTPDKKGPINTCDPDKQGPIPVSRRACLTFFLQFSICYGDQV